jgi:hypothetical protein
MFTSLNSKRVALAVLAVMILVVGWTHYFLIMRSSISEDNDIYYDFLEAKKITVGENPYERILSGDMRSNDKYATYFPLFYLLSAGIIKLGFQEFQQFVAFWRLGFLFCNIGAGVVLFYLLWPRRGLLLAVFGVLFWFFGRWNLRLTTTGNIDYLAIFFLLLAFWLLPRHRVWAFVVLGLSLGIKQLDVILVPLFLILVWQSESQHRARALLVAIAALASTLVITSAPFFAAGPEAFLKSMIFEGVRNPSRNSDAALGVYLGWSGSVSRLPVIILMALVYALFWRRKIGFYTAGLLAMITFITTNPVLFSQYFVWLTPFFPLAASEVFFESKKTPAVPATDRIGVASPGVGRHGAPDGA